MQLRFDASRVVALVTAIAQQHARFVITAIADLTRYAAVTRALAAGCCSAGCVPTLVRLHLVLECKPASVILPPSAALPATERTMCQLVRMKNSIVMRHISLLMSNVREIRQGCVSADVDMVSLLQAKWTTLTLTLC